MIKAIPLIELPPSICWFQPQLHKRNNSFDTVSAASFCNVRSHLRRHISSYSFQSPSLFNLVNDQKPVYCICGKGLS